MGRSGDRQMRLEREPSGEEEGRKTWPRKAEERIKFGYWVDVALEEPLEEYAGKKPCLGVKCLDR